MRKVEISEAATKECVELVRLLLIECPDLMDGGTENLVECSELVQTIVGLLEQSPAIAREYDKHDWGK